ncbi:hypothetical protein [Clostridium botulinum]|uniref:hypothetical protein n=1 Tax=Clostridium botulinum TaxID=1491 RepID=UPI0007730295|nr:hypothetical protein [Clostridium botulinum]NFL85690.1 hypothetical protein [Clostridium botulinum]
MGWHKEILISPEELNRCSVLRKEIIVKKSTDVLITGKIVDKNNNPIAKAIVSIKQINNTYYSSGVKEYGYLTTNEEGEYAVLLPCSYNFDYVLDVYEPIVKC